MIKEVSWIPPDDGWVKVNCDGATRGNLGVGLVFRTNDQILGKYAKGLGGVTNYEAKTKALVLATELANYRLWRSFWLETDSMGAKEAFMKKYIPWEIYTRWCNVTKNLQNLKISHTYRETNFGADSMAKYGAGVVAAEGTCWNSLPSTKIEDPPKTQYRVIS